MRAGGQLERVQTSCFGLNFPIFGLYDLSLWQRGTGFFKLLLVSLSEFGRLGEQPNAGFVFLAIAFGEMRPPAPNPFLLLLPPSLAASAFPRPPCPPTFLNRCPSRLLVASPRLVIVFSPSCGEDRFSRLSSRFSSSTGLPPPPTTHHLRWPTPLLHKGKLPLLGA